MKYPYELTREIGQVLNFYSFTYSLMMYPGQGIPKYQDYNPEMGEALTNMVAIVRDLTQLTCYFTKKLNQSLLIVGYFLEFSTLHIT